MGQRVYVTDLGFNRVLIWNSDPDQEQQPADVEMGRSTLRNQSQRFGTCAR